MRLYTPCPCASIPPLLPTVTVFRRYLFNTDKISFEIVLHSHHIGVGLEISKSPINTWVLVNTSPDIELWDSFFGALERPVHFVFSETMTNSIVPNFALSSLQRMTGSVVIKAQGLKPGHPKAESLIEKMRTTGIGPADWEAQPEVFWDYADVGGRFPVLHDVAAFSYDCVYAMAIATCNGEGNDALLGLPTVNFEGASGEVRFAKDSGARDPDSAYMTASEFEFDPTEPSSSMFKLKYEFSGKWSDLDGEAQLSPIAMESDATFTELVPVEIKEIRVDPSVEIIILAVAAFVIASGVLFTIWTMINHNTKIIRRSQPQFLYILSTGCILSGFVPIVITMESSQTCQTAWMLYAVGFSISIGSLSAKTLRVWRITKAASNLRAYRLSLVDALPPLLFILIIDVVIASLMIQQGDVDWVEIELSTDSYGRVLEKEFRCQSKGPVFSAFLLVNIAILTFLATICYRARNINSDFSESKYVSMSLASSLQIAVLGFLLIAISDNTPAVEYLMVSLMTLVIAVSILYLVFVPKMYLLHINSVNIKGENVEYAGSMSTRSTESGSSV